LNETTVKLGDALEVAPSAVFIAALVIARHVLDRHKPPWFRYLQTPRTLPTRFEIYKTTTALTFAWVLIGHVLWGVGMFLRVRATGEPLHIPYVSWIIDVLVMTAVFPLFSFLLSSKEDEPEDWLDWNKNEIQTAEEA
jgi:hypothetical protein